MLYNKNEKIMKVTVNKNRIELAQNQFNTLSIIATKSGFKIHQSTEKSGRAKNVVYQLSLVIKDIFNNKIDKKRDYNQRLSKIAKVLLENEVTSYRVALNVLNKNFA